jgi:integrase
MDCGLIECNPFLRYQSGEGWRNRLALRKPNRVPQTARCGSLTSTAGNDNPSILLWASTGRAIESDFESGRLRVVRKRAAAGKAEWTPKDNNLRVLPLCTEVMNVLTNLHSGAKEGQVHVFVNAKGPARGGRMKPQNVWRYFQTIRIRAGLPKCSLHGLRKSYCTNLAGLLPMHVVQELAGHSDIRTTRQYYLKVVPESVEAARQDVVRHQD